MNIKSMTASLEDTFISTFDRKIGSQVRLNLLFTCILLLEVSFFFFFFSFFFKSALLAMILALILFTIFGFLILKQYLMSQKITHFEKLLCNLMDELEKEQEPHKKNPQDYIKNAKILLCLSEKLYHHEYSYYHFLKKIPFLAPWIERLSAYLHWKDVHATRELLLKAATREYIAFVRKEPTNPEAHALLANAYVMLSGLYLDPRKPEEDEKWVPANKFDEIMQEKFQDAAKKAIEEFKILKDYAPNDPWVYSQLAYSYRDLKMPDLEKEAYEAILALRPHDQETRYKLGTLYFEQGENAKGLQIYESLKNAHFAKAEELVKVYGKN